MRRVGDIGEVGFLVAAEGELFQQSLEPEGDLDEGGDIRVELLRGLLVGVQGVHLAGTGVEGEVGVEQPADDGPFARALRGVLEVLDVNDVLDEGQAIGALDGLTQPERPGGNADGLQEAAALGVRGGGRKGVAGRVTRRSSPKMSTSSLRVTSKSTADAGGAAMDLGPSPSVCPIQTNGPWLGRVGSRFRADRSANARRTPEPRDSSRVCPAGR